MGRREQKLRGQENKIAQRLEVAGRTPSGLPRELLLQAGAAVCGDFLS